jgi:hypothetical protein
MKSLIITGLFIQFWSINKINLYVMAYKNEENDKTIFYELSLLYVLYNIICVKGECFYHVTSFSVKVHMCERGMFLYHVTSFSVKSICVKEECFYHVTSFSVKSICVKEECFYHVTSFSVKFICVKEECFYTMSRHSL